MLKANHNYSSDVLKLSFQAANNWRLVKTKAVVPKPQHLPFLPLLYLFGNRKLHAVAETQRNESRYASGKIKFKL